MKLLSCKDAEKSNNEPSDLTHPGQHVVKAVWTLLILIVVSFVMLWLGDKLNAAGMAATRFMARGQAPLTAQFVYPNASREQITVVMYDREFLDNTGSAWPLSYREHADTLMRLVSAPSGRPKAIFLDITFGQERDDPSVHILQETLCKISNDYKVPVFLAGLPSQQTRGLTIRSGLIEKPSRGKRCFTLVGVDYVPDPIDGVAWSYQLTRHLGDAGWVSGPPNSGEDQPSYRSAAMAMAQDVAQIDLGEERTPMAMVWGHNSAPQEHRPAILSNCRPGTPEYMSLIPGLLRQVWEGEQLPLCPYHQTLSLDQINNLDEAEIASYIHNKYIMIGGQVPGHNDFANSPVHGITPGVHMHAMALDNLLTYKSDYKLSAEWTLPPSWQLLRPGLIVIFVVFLMHLGLQAARESSFIKCVKSRVWSRVSRANDLFKWARDRPYISGTMKLTFESAEWIIDILLKAMAAMIAIAILQCTFRVGMLPVVELVGMTLLAEGLGYVRKLKEYYVSPNRVSHFRFESAMK